MDLTLLGIVLALAAALVYLTGKWKKAENEKATLESTKVAAETKIQLLETAALKQEAAQRAREDVEVFDDDMERSTTPFYPGVRDPNDLN